MSKFEITYARGATPLTPEEREGLKPKYISTQGELNALEQANILDAYIWAKNIELDELLTATFLKKLHYKMLNEVWEWAGKQRDSNKNIGVSKEMIGQELGTLLNAVRSWIEDKTFSFDEIAVRFHHKLVQIHMFPNGNGRHARLATQLLLRALGEKDFSWGAGGDLNVLEIDGHPIRSRYIEALQAADDHEIEPLKQFVRS